MANADQSSMGGSDPEMVSGTTGMGNDLQGSMEGLSGSITPGSLSTADPHMVDELGADSDSLADMNDPTSVSGGPDLGGTMGGTGGMDADTAPVLDSDAMPIEDPADNGTDAAAGRDGGTSTDLGTDGGDGLGSYGGDAGDATADALSSGTDADGGMSAPYGGNTADPLGSDYLAPDDAGASGS